MLLTEKSQSSCQFLGVKSAALYGASLRSSGLACETQTAQPGCELHPALDDACGTTQLDVEYFVGNDKLDNQKSCCDNIYKL
jgi:hypothetical protein